MDSSDSNSHDREKTSDLLNEDPELLNQPPFNIPPGTGHRSSGHLRPTQDGRNGSNVRSRSSLAGLPSRWKSTPRVDGKRELTEDDCYDILAYRWPKWKKWGFLSVCDSPKSPNFPLHPMPRSIYERIKLEQPEKLFMIYSQVFPNNSLTIPIYSGDRYDPDLHEFQYFSLPKCCGAHRRTLWRQ